MGHSYGRDSRGIRVLACDRCGSLRSVRKRTCSVRLLLSSKPGQRTERPWCQPPALCPDCFHELGGTTGVHVRCAEEAAKAQEQQDTDQSRLDAGDLALFSITTRDVPAGTVRLTFYPTDPVSDSPVRILVPVELYDPAKRWLSDYPHDVRMP